MENYTCHIRKVKKNLFKKPLIIYKITSDDALIYCLKITQFLLEFDSTEKIYVEDVNLIRAGLLEKREELNCLKETKKSSLNKIFEFNLRLNHPDLCIVIGGDGTILWANHIFQSEARPPFLAFNLGTLGYMATYCSECFKCVLENVLNPNEPVYYETRTLLKGQFLLKQQHKQIPNSKENLNSLLKRSSSLNFKSEDLSENAAEKFLKLNLSSDDQNDYIEGNPPSFNLNLNSDLNSENGEKNNIKNLLNKIEHTTELQIDYKDNCEERVIYALNDITIERKDFTHMINTEIYYNNEPLTMIKSNGIIISSPTGSTAYSLSAGGTIMHYGLDCLVLNSVAPHSLSFRPIAFPRGDKLKIILTKESKDAIVINDGISKHNLTHSQGIQVEVSDKSVEFVLTQKFFENKSMMWKQKIINQLGWNNAFKNVEYSGCEIKDIGNSE